MRWQSRHPSVMARVLIANSLLSSCLWFFAYFMVPSEQQLHSFDAMVWGMLWGKNRGDVGSKGVVSRHRVAQPHLSAGGLIPSVMIRAIRANKVNRGLVSDRGRWWTSLFHYWCEKASGG